MVFTASLFLFVFFVFLKVVESRARKKKRKALAASYEAQYSGVIQLFFRFSFHPHVPQIRVHVLELDSGIISFGGNQFLMVISRAGQFNSIHRLIRFFYLNVKQSNSL